MNTKKIGVIVASGILVLGGVVEGAQRGWTISLKPLGSTATTHGVTAIVAPQATIGGPANGIFCTSAVENGVSVQELGGLPAGIHVTVNLQSFSTDFNPVAAVIVSKMGANGANNIQTTTFYDDDSGGGSDPKVDFVTPHAGVYLLLVNDKTDANVGCFRYQLTLQ